MRVDDESVGCCCRGIEEAQSRGGGAEASSGRAYGARPDLPSPVILHWPGDRPVSRSLHCLEHKQTGSRDVLLVIFHGLSTATTITTARGDERTAFPLEYTQCASYTTNCRPPHERAIYRPWLLRLLYEGRMSAFCTATKHTTPRSVEGDDEAPFSFERSLARHAPLSPPPPPQRPTTRIYTQKSHRWRHECYASRPTLAFLSHQRRRTEIPPPRLSQQNTPYQRGFSNASPCSRPCKGVFRSGSTFAGSGPKAQQAQQHNSKVTKQAQA